VKLLDTTVAVDYLRGRPAAVALLEALAGTRDEIIASELVRFELLAGAREHELDELQQFFTALDWVPVNGQVVRVGGELARRYRPSHGGIEDVDYLIAANALVLDVELLTTNIRHFPMLEDCARVLTGPR
jgi:predicted nucleic acid-binding protein